MKSLKQSQLVCATSPMLDQKSAGPTRAIASHEARSLMASAGVAAWIGARSEPKQGAIFTYRVQFGVKKLSLLSMQLIGPLDNGWPVL